MINCGRASSGTLLLLFVALAATVLGPGCAHALGVACDGDLRGVPAHCVVSSEDTLTDVLIEIPEGGSAKYEIDPCTGAVHVDRFLPPDNYYPANYGYIPDTRAGDGDPLDVLVITREPLVPASRIRVRILGVLRMIDGGEEDHKLIAVPAPAVDPPFAQHTELEDLDRELLVRVESFFQRYKLTPEGTTPIELRGYGAAAEGIAMLRDARDRAPLLPVCG